MIGWNHRDFASETRLETEDDQNARGQKKGKMFRFQIFCEEFSAIFLNKLIPITVAPLHHLHRHPFSCSYSHTQFPIHGSALTSKTFLAQGRSRGPRVCGPEPPPTDWAHHTRGCTHTRTLYAARNTIRPHSSVQARAYAFTLSAAHSLTYARPRVQYSTCTCARAPTPSVEPTHAGSQSAHVVAYSSKLLHLSYDLNK